MPHPVIQVGLSIYCAMAQLSDQVFVFSGATLEAALAEWVEEQIAAYPHQEERIRIVALAMQEFLTSPQARRHKMSIGTERRES